MTDDSAEQGGGNLTQLHARARRLVAETEGLRSVGTAYNAKVREAVAALQECREAADRVGLFSANETVDDLTTGSLRYMALDAERGDLLQRGDYSLPPASGGGSIDADMPALRRRSLQAARDAYTAFLRLLDGYGLLRPGAGHEREAWDRFGADPDNFSVLSGNAADPAARRAAKIARLREEKALRARLETLKARAGHATDDADAETAEATSDDDALRTLRLAELQLRAMDALQALDMIGQELRILAQAPPPGELAAAAAAREADEDRRQRGRSSNDDNYSDRLDPSRRELLAGGRAGPILDSGGRPLQPFTLLDRRQELRRGVFRPGHRLPTMSIDEYLEEERRRGGIIEGGGEPPVVEPNEDDIDAADRETMKQRHWDEFKEENPRGSGNTLNRG